MAAATTAIERSFGRATNFFADVSERVPFGSETARMAAFTGLVESFFMSRGSVGSTLGGGVLGWLSTWLGEAASAWTTAAEEGSFRRGWFSPVVDAIARVKKVLPGMRDSAPLAGAIGCVFGAAVGFFTKKEENESRIGKVFFSTFEHGFRRLVAAYSADRVVAAADEMRGKLPKIQTKVRAWKPGTRDVDVTLSGMERLPTHGHVQAEDRRWRRRLSKEKLGRLQQAITESNASIKKLYDLAGWPEGYRPERIHRVYITSEKARYQPLSDTLARASLDLDGESFVRVVYEELAKDFAQVDLRLALLKSKLRAEVNGTRLHTEGKGVDQVLKVTGGFRCKTLEPHAAERAARVSEQEVEDFENAVSTFLVHLIDEERNGRVPSKSHPLATAFSKYHRLLPEEQRPLLLRALLEGKTRMTLQPILDFFATGPMPEAARAVYASLEPRERDIKFAHDVMTLWTDYPSKTQVRRAEQRDRRRQRPRGPQGPPGSWT